MTERTTWSRVREFFCGSFAGVGLVLAGHPFDTIKVRLQAEGGFGRFKGPIHCLYTTLKQERVFGLYKGAMGPLIGQGLVSSMQFGILSNILPYIQKVYTLFPPTYLIIFVNPAILLLNDSLFFVSLELLPNYSSTALQLLFRFSAHTRKGSGPSCYTGRAFFGSKSHGWSVYVDSRHANGRNQGTLTSTIQ